MRQDEIVVDLEQHQLLAQAVLMLAQRVDPTADRRHMLPEVEIEALAQFIILCSASNLAVA